MSDKITVHKVNLGYDIEEEIEKELKEGISKETLEDAKDIIEALSNRPGNKKAAEKIELEKKLEEVSDIIKNNGSISKDELCTIVGKNTISSVNLLRSFCVKYLNCKLIKKGKDAYAFADLQ